METRQIEFVETRTQIGIEVFYAGDKKTFPKAEADEYIRVGWAKCCETGEQGERKPGSVLINIHSIKQEVR